MQHHRSILHIIHRVANELSLGDGVRPTRGDSIARLLIIVRFLFVAPCQIPAVRLRKSSVIPPSVISRHFRFCKTKSHVTTHESSFFLIYPSIIYSIILLTLQIDSIALDHQRCFETAEVGRTFWRTKNVHADRTGIPVNHVNSTNTAIDR